MPEADINIPMATAVPVSEPYSSSSSQPHHSTTTMPTSNTLPTNLLPVNRSPDLTQEQLDQLQAQGFPVGLASELGRNRNLSPVRFWVIDNSGSMNTPDGNELRSVYTAKHGNHLQVVPCTRWTELQGSLVYHIQLAGFLESTSMFRMLNHPGSSVGRQEFAVQGGQVQQVEDAVRIVKTSTPRGVTPLTQHLAEIKKQILCMESELRQKDQQAVIILATDGLPSDRHGNSNEAVLTEFTNALKEMQYLPVWIVVRLCTDDELVVDYYNGFDENLELPLEVIDDFFGEAAEIHKKNKWLNYGLPLHRCREMGYHHRLIDLLDEQLLLKDQLVEFLHIMFGNTYQWPDPHVQWKEFLEELEHLLKVQAPQYNPITGKMEPWIDINKLKRVYPSRGDVVHRGSAGGKGILGRFGWKK